MYIEATNKLSQSRYILYSWIIATCILIAPLLISFLTIGWRVIFSLFAADSMYYMGVANNWVRYGFPTFDGEQISNGFHPLWELLITGVFWIFHVPHDYQLYVVFALSFVLVSVSLTLLGSIAMGRFGLVRGGVVILLMFPGAYTLLGNPASHVSGDPGVLYRLEPWSAINGMESTLSLALWSLAIYLVIRRLEIGKKYGEAIDQSVDWPFIINLPVRIVLVGIVLTRLDDAIILASIGIVALLFNRGSTFQRIHQLSKILILPVIALVAYLSINLVVVGTPLPVSGVSKTGFALLQNLFKCASSVLGLDIRWSWIYVAERAYPVMFCITLAIISIFLLKTKFIEAIEKSRLYQLMLILFIYILIKSLFLLFFISFWLQGYWYYFVMIFILNFIIASALISAIPSRRDYEYTALAGAALVVTLALGNETHLLNTREGMIDIVWLANYTETAYQLWTHKKDIREAFVKQDPSAKLIDNYDGMYGYLLDMPAVSVSGLVSGKKDLDDRKKIGFWNSVLPRGYSIISRRGYLNLENETGIKWREFYKSPDGKIEFYQVMLAAPEDTGAPGTTSATH